MTDITIIIPSYNRGKYIAQALDSVLMQECNYQYHIIIADDCSTDNSIEIIQNYKDRYPDKITVLLSDKNQKLYKNILRAYAITKTDYFTVLDPDDYWTDNKKIQKALDFLEANKDYNIYTGNSILNYPDGSTKLWCNKQKAVTRTFNDFLKGKMLFGHTSSSIFRNVIFKNGLPEKMTNISMPYQEQSYRGDSFRNFIHLEKGKIKYVPKTDSVYRITEDGIWQSANKFDKDLLNIFLFKNMWLYFDKKYPQMLVFSYKITESVKQNLINDLSEIDFNIEQNIINKLRELNSFYSENKEIIDKNIKENMGFKYKILLYVYKKLSKKGFIIK